MSVVYEFGEPRKKVDIKSFMKEMGKIYDKELRMTYSNKELSLLKTKCEKMLNITEDDVKSGKYKKLVDEMICISGMNQRITTEVSMIPGTKLYRVRTLDKNEINNVEIWNEKDEGQFWEPPIERIKRGRLNDVNESILYTTIENALVPFDEVKVKEGQTALVIQYEIIEPFDVIGVGVDPNFRKENVANRNCLLGCTLVNDVLKTIFSMEISEANEYLYEVTNYIVKRYFSFQDELGWIYTSVKEQRAMNLALKPQNARNNIKRTGLYVACKEGENLNIIKVIGGDVLLPQSEKITSIETEHVLGVFDNRQKKILNNVVLKNGCYKFSFKKYLLESTGNKAVFILYAVTFDYLSEEWKDVFNIQIPAKGFIAPILTIPNIEFMILYLAVVTEEGGNDILDIQCYKVY